MNKFTKEDKQVNFSNEIGEIEWCNIVGIDHKELLELNKDSSTLQKEPRKTLYNLCGKIKDRVPNKYNSDKVTELIFLILETRILDYLINHVTKDFEIDNLIDFVFGGKEQITEDYELIKEGLKDYLKKVCEDWEKED